MNDIRPLERADLPAAAALFEEVVSSEHDAAGAGLVEFFARTLFDHPWADPEVPSLAAFEDGRLAGFMGSHVRRLRLDGRAARLAVSGPLVVRPDARHPALGAVLARRYLDGPQNITLTDGASALMRTLWERLGGQSAHLRCVEWILPLRPVSLAAASWRRRRRDLEPDRRRWRVPGALDRLSEAAMRSAGRLMTPLTVTLVTAGRDGAVRVPRVHAAPVTAEPLTAEAFVEHLPTLARGRRLVPAYDREFAEWLFAELAAVRGRGSLVARLVRRGERVVGCYLYFLQRDGLSSVIAVLGADETANASLLDALIADARARGAAGLSGRVETDLLAPVAALGAFLVYRGQALVHSSDPALLALATSPQALLTRLEGEHWMTPQLLRRSLVRSA